MFTSVIRGAPDREAFDQPAFRIGRHRVEARRKPRAGIRAAVHVEYFQKSAVRFRLRTTQLSAFDALLFHQRAGQGIQFHLVTGGTPPGKIVRDVRITFRSKQRVHVPIVSRIGDQRDRRKRRQQADRAEIQRRALEGPEFLDQSERTDCRRYASRAADSKTGNGIRLALGEKIRHNLKQ